MFTTRTVKGSELQVGDILHVWWSNNRQQTPKRSLVTNIVTYNGPLKDLFREGATIAMFADYKSGMTIECGNYYQVDRENK
jgi:hypothetical protein